MRLDTGGLIDRGRRIGFRFDGRALHGLGGDTLASALIANGVRLVGRSFRLHRPRGILAAGPEEPNALVGIGRGARHTPNIPATVQELIEGLEARSQNRWPSLGLDLLAVNDLLAPLLGAGFYHKTFIWPPGLWERVAEPLIRRAAGLGRLSMRPDPDGCEAAFAHCDLLVIGAGPAGLAAALAAGRAGARVILAEEDTLPGGRLNAERIAVGGMAWATWAAQAAAELAGLPNVRLMTRTTVFGAFDDGAFGAVERVADHLPVPRAGCPRQTFWRIRARRSVLAAGAVERIVAFPGNDRPGVMLAGAVRTFLNRFAAAPGRRIAVFAANDDAWRTAADAGAAGLEAIMIDPRPAPGPGVPPIRGQVIRGHGVAGTTGRRGLTGIRLDDGRRIAADCLAISGGWNPAVHLACHAGARPVWDPGIAAFLPPPTRCRGCAWPAPRPAVSPPARRWPTGRRRRSRRWPIWASPPPPHPRPNAATAPAPPARCGMSGATAPPSSTSSTT
ncbi:MAG: hypothetical protein KatS3mg118_1763 [Paracoccaceae bacterium]|nr:MAG: hypothetical protein KatS3mg118_1763 [Paracoccaceae bacterium]